MRAGPDRYRQRKGTSVSETKPAKGGGKISIEKLGHLDQLTFDGASVAEKNTLYKLDVDGFRFDFLWRPKTHQPRLFVMFSGDARRDKYTPPVFQRWSWAKRFPGSCLFFSDPSLQLSDKLGLAWYSGTTDFDPLIPIRGIVERVAELIGVAPDGIFSYGSSGGGFAALRLCSMMSQAGCVTINPQIVIPRYIERHVRLYLDTCFGGISPEEALARFPDRFDLSHNPGRFRDKRIIFMQNTLDTHHFDEHYGAFCRSIGTSLEASAAAEPGLTKVLFERPGGHAKGEGEAEFDLAMTIVRSYPLSSDGTAGQQSE